MRDVASRMWEVSAREVGDAGRGVPHVGGLGARGGDAGRGPEPSASVVHPAPSPAAPQADRAPRSFQSATTAPPGSASTAKRPIPGNVLGDTSTRPPSSAALLATTSQSWTAT
jgi:hypothetical protein